MNDFVEETDYSRVPTAELLTRIEQYADILRGASLFDLERIMSPARELAARAERAEADNLDNIMAALGMNADEARRLREENAALRAQLDEATLDEALRSIGTWGEIIRQAIEDGETIPPEALTVSFRQLTPAEMAYGLKIAQEFVGEDVTPAPDEEARP